MPPLIKIAGVKNRMEAQLLIENGANCLGFPLRLDVHQPDLSESDAAEIMREFKSICPCFLITYINKADEIIDFMHYLNTDYVQLHGGIELEELKKLKLKNNKIFIIKSLVVRPDNEETLNNGSLM